MPLLVTLMTPPVAPPNSAVIAARLDLDFFDEVGDRTFVPDDAGLQVGGLDAVDDEAVLAGAGAVDRDAASFGSRCWRPGACVTSVCEVAAMRQQLDLLGADVGLARALRTSTSGVSAVTVTDSATPASRTAKSTFLITGRPTTDFDDFRGDEALEIVAHDFGTGRARATGSGTRRLASVVVERRRQWRPWLRRWRRAAPRRTRLLTTPSIEPRCSCAHAGAASER